MQELTERTAADITRALRRRRLVVDHVFDEVFPLSMRGISDVYWTPVEVAVRAARLLAPAPDKTILDIGAGVGKFCIVAGAAVKARIRGVEHRPHLVDIARTAAQKLRVDVDLVHGTVEGEDPRAIDGVYMFNPFAENLCEREDRLDGTVELGVARHARDVAATQTFLRAARSGTRVVTYCGFGGEMPEEYVLALREQRDGRFELWVKR